MTGLYVGQLDSVETRRLFDSDSAAVFASNHLLFVRDSTLFAQRFDVASLLVTENPFRVAEGITVAGGAGVALSASAAGPVVYRGGTAQTLRQLSWFDRSGRRLSVVGSPFDGDGLSLSPDGRRVAMYVGSGGNNDIWLMDVSRGLLSRFTSSMSSETFPIWSPDGRRIVFGSDRAGTSDLYEKPALGSGVEILMFGTTESESALDWSSDGRFLLYRGTSSAGAYDLWALPLEGDRTPIRLTQTPFDERDGQFSPDGKWVAYQSDESGQFEVYVQPFPGPGERIRISTDGGAQVRWGRDGGELYYIALDERLMAVPIRPSVTADALEVSASEPLFATRIGGALQGVSRQQYMVSPDGQQFLMNTLADQAATPLTVILNWNPDRR